MTKKLTPEDLHLWKVNMREVKPLHTPLPHSDPEPLPPPPASPLVKTETPLKQQRVTPQIQHLSLNRKEIRRFKYEARLDLHGLALEKGYQVLEKFLSTAQERGIKEVLIITGKGALSETRTFRHQLPRWVEEAPLRNLVLSLHHPAKLQDGGTGAFYLRVRERKNRTHSRKLAERD